FAGAMGLLGTAGHVPDRHHLDIVQSGWNRQSTDPDHAESAGGFVRFSVGQMPDVPRESGSVQHSPALYGLTSSALFHKSEIKETGIEFACMLRIYAKMRTIFV